MEYDMNAPSFIASGPTAFAAKRGLTARLPVSRLAGRIAHYPIATVIAGVVLVAGIWSALTPAAAQILAAATWGAGFVFVALSIDASIRRAVPYVITGVALPALAVLGSSVSGLFSVLAVALLAGWVAAWLARRA
jgi:hypothetical protein